MSVGRGPIRALVVDDEPLARERLTTLLRDVPDVECVGECGDGRAALAALEEERPDLLFLDVQMPELGGFEVLDAIEPERMPVVIFVTAYDDYALRAFDAHAVDYLLKPFDRERFDWALRRARTMIAADRGNELAERLRSLLAEVRPTARRLIRIPVRSGGNVVFLRAEEIEWIEGAGNYVRLHAGDRSHLIRATLRGLEERLDPDRFVRVHRSAIVNLDHVRALQPWFHGDYVVIMESGARVNTGRTYQPAIRRLLEGV